MLKEQQLENIFQDNIISQHGELISRLEESLVTDCEPEAMEPRTTIYPNRKFCQISKHKDNHF